MSHIDLWQAMLVSGFQKQDAAVFLGKQKTVDVGPAGSQTSLGWEEGKTQNL